MANPNAQFPAQNIVTDQGVYPFSALLEVIKRLIASLFGAGASTVVWRPGAVSSGNVFATWAEVVAAVATLNGNITIALDNSLAAAVIPAGAWDLRPAGVNGSVVIVGATKTNATSFITIAAAAVTIHGLSGIQDVSIDSQSTSDVITATPTDQVNFYLYGSAQIYQNSLAATAFFRALAGSLFQLNMKDFSFISTFGAGTNAIQAAVGTTTILIEDDSVLDTNQLSAPGGASVFVSAVTTIIGGFLPYQPQAAAPTTFPFGMRQKGSNAIVVGTGKTAVIPAFINATSRILVSVKTPVGDALTIKYGAISADRVVGFPGTFQISALAAAGGGAINGVDTSTIDWEVEN